MEFSSKHHVLAKILLIYMSCSYGFAGEKEAAKAFDEGDYKEAIALYQEAVKSSSKSDKGILKAKLALTYYRDQEDEKAFRIYLEALADAPRLSAPPMTPEESQLYNDALRLYLEHSGLSAHEIANTIRQKYSPILAIHPNYYQLNFIVAAAYANLGMFEEFFNSFYRSYQYFPETYMAFKTQSILYLKLYEKAKTPEEHEIGRQHVLTYAQKANACNSQDATLYRIMIAFSKDADHDQVLIKSLKKIINTNTIVPRVDILFYVKEAIAAKQFELAQQFIDKAKIWYTYSRTLEAAQNYLDENKA